MRPAVWAPQASQVRAVIGTDSGRTEELLAHIVIDANHVPTFTRQKARALGSDEAAGPGNHYFFGR